MLSSTPTPPPSDRPASPAARDQSGPIERWHAWSHLSARLQGRRARLFGSRVLALGLAVCVSSGTLVAPSAAAQRVAASSAASSVSEQFPPPSPTAAPIRNNPLFVPSQARTPTPTPTAIPTPTAVAAAQTGDVVPVQGDIIGAGQPTPMAIVPVQVGPAITISGQPAPNSVQVQITPSTGNAANTTVASAGSSIRRGDCISPDFIFQGCPLGSAEAERRLEAQAIAAVLQDYQVPESERQRVLRYGRNEVRAALYAMLEDAFEKQSSARNADERLLVQVFTRTVRDRHLQAMREAQNEYREWSNDPCGYRPPDGFSYDARSACIGASQTFRPESPGLQAFVSYGLKKVYDDVAISDPMAPRAFLLTSAGMVQIYGLVVTGAAATLGSKIAIPGAVLNVVAPFATRRALDITAAAADVVSSTTSSASSTTGSASSATTTSSAASGAFSMAGLLAILVASISTAITGSMTLAREVELPGQLQGLIDAAPNFDVEWIMQTCRGTTGCVTAYSTDARSIVEHELYTAFMFTTLPEYPGNEPAPAARPGDPRLVVDGRPVDWLRYKADDDNGSPRAFRLGPGSWFVDRPDGAGDAAARLALQISFKDASDATWTARRVGNQFLISRTGVGPTNINYVEPRQSADLSVVDPSGNNVTARVGS